MIMPKEGGCTGGIGRNGFGHADNGRGHGFQHEQRGLKPIGQKSVQRFWQHWRAFSRGFDAGAVHRSAAHHDVMSLARKKSQGAGCVAMRQALAARSLATPQNADVPSQPIQPDQPQQAFPTGDQRRHPEDRSGEVKGGPCSEVTGHLCQNFARTDDATGATGVQAGSGPKSDTCRVCQTADRQAPPIRMTCVSAPVSTGSASRHALIRSRRWNASFQLRVRPHLHHFDQIKACGPRWRRTTSRHRVWQFHVRERQG